MSTFHKPENAIRRVEELRSIGQDETALQLLHSVVNHRRFRVHGWDSSQELMMIQYIILSVDLQKPRMAREGLHQYRYVTHQSNVGSLGKVIVEFRNRAEEQLKTVKNECVDCMDPNLIKEDLEQEETPESLLLASLQIERKGAKEKRLHETLRFTWEAYKMILDIIRLTPKLERIYHETAQRALEFCWLHNRASEFKTLCELLRSHYQLLLSNRHRPEIDVMLRPECHIETRIVQLRGAAKLSLWNECFTTAEEIFHLGIFQFDPVVGSAYSQNSLLKSGSNQTQNSVAPGSTGNNSNSTAVQSAASGASSLQTGLGGVAAAGSASNPDNAHALKMRPSYLRWIALYYDILSKMFLLTENYSFHALAHLKYFLHIEQFKKNVSKEELTKMASTVVLAILSIPLNESSATLNSKSRYHPNQFGHHGVSLNDVNQTQNDQVKKAALLLGSPFIPTRDILKSMLISKNILSLSLPVCRELYDIIEGRSNTLKLCTNTSGHLANLIELDSGFAEYTKPLKVTILTKLFLLISKVYSSINIDHFLDNICRNEFLPWTDTEKLLVQLSSSSIINLRIDYKKRCIYSINKDFNNYYDDINGSICSMMGYGLSHSNLYSSPTSSLCGLRGGISSTNSNVYSRFNNQVTRSACILETILRKIDKENIKAGLSNQYNKISQMVLRRLPMEMNSMEKRIEEIKYRRKEKIEEMKRVEEDKKRQEKEAKAQEELMEIQKREEDRRRREEARQLEEIRRSKVEACKMMLDTIKKFEFKNTNNKMLIKGKVIEEITLDDLLEGKILFDDLEKLQEEQCNFERQERIKQRRMEAKRLDHLARAYRLEEIPLINEWHKETVKSDIELNKKLHESYLLRMEEVKEEINLEKEALRNLVPLLDTWKQKQIEIRKVELENALKCQRQRCIKKIKDLKISRAKIRRNEAIERKLHEEEQKRREEEAKKEEEEARILEEAKRQKEEKRLKLQRQFEIQKKREEEIEAKLQAQANSSKGSNHPGSDNIVFTRGGGNNATSCDSGKNSVGTSGNFSRSSNYGSSRSGNSSGVTISRQKTTNANRNESPSKTDFNRGNNSSFNNRNVNFGDIRRVDSTGNNNVGGGSSAKDQSSTRHNSSGNSYRSSQRNNQRDTRDIDNNKWR